MAFTVITLGSSWQDLALAQEIAAAYDKRAAACGSAALAAPDADTAVIDFVAAVQSGLAAMAPHWADPAAALEGVDIADLANYADAAALLAAAGLTSEGGWRRIPEGNPPPADWTDTADPAWSFGPIESKDMAGPWLFRDLQLALSAMTRQFKTHTGAAATFTATEQDTTQEPASPSLPAPSYSEKFISSGSVYGEWLRLWGIRSRETIGGIVDRYELGWITYTPAIALTGLSAHSKTATMLIVATSGVGGATYNDFGTGWMPDVTTAYSAFPGSTETELSFYAGGSSSSFYSGLLDTFPAWSSIVVDDPPVSRALTITAVLFAVDYAFSA